MNVISGILQGAPIWVWPLLVLLVVVGLRATKTREVPVWLAYATPLLGLISINRLVDLPNPALVWSVYAIGYAAGLAAGYALQRRWLISKQGGRLKLEGEWVTFTTMMLLFSMSFVGGIVSDINAGLYGSFGFIVVYTGLIAIASGSFLGRALRLYRTQE